MRVKLKRPVEVPGPIQAFIDGVLAVPLDSIAEPLRGFSWSYDKGDFTQWVALFNRFDEFFDERIRPRADLQLKPAAPGQPDPPFPVDACIQVLRVTAVLLENCGSKHLYTSYEHLSALLAAPSPAVVAAALQTLVSFLKKTHHANIRWQGFKDLNFRLQALAQGWGGKEQGMELVTCVAASERTIKAALPTVTSLRFDFYSERPPGGAATTGAAGLGGQVVISLSPAELDALAAKHGSSHGVMSHLVAAYGVPEHERFPLYVKLCRARDFRTLEGRRHHVAIRLMALVVLAQSHSASDDIMLAMGGGPELVLELVGMVSPASTVSGLLPASGVGSGGGAPPSRLPPGAVPDWLRALAVRALAVLLQDRARHSAVISAINGGVGQGGPGLLSHLLQSTITAYVAGGSMASGAPQAQPGPAATSAPALGAGVSDPGPSGAPPAVPDPEAEHTALLLGEGGQGAGLHDLLEALLSLVGALALSAQGCQVLGDAGVVQMLLVLLEDRSPEHLQLVANCVKLIESCLDMSPGVAAAYREVDGVHVVIKRLSYEVGVASGGALAAGQDASMAGDAPSIPPTAAPEAASSTGSAADGSAAVAYPRKVLIKFLLRAVAISSYSPSTGVATRPQDADSALLYACLRTLFERAAAFGGSLFALAASVMADAIHHDPLSYRVLDDAGVPEAFLTSVKAGVLPYGEALISISSALGALCLNTGGLARVKEARMMQVYVPLFTSRKYSKALSGDTPVIVGSGLEELFRFVPQLRPDGAQAVVDILRGLCILGGDTEQLKAGEAALREWRAAADAAAAAAVPPPAPAAPAPMETDGGPTTTQPPIGDAPPAAIEGGAQVGVDEVMAGQPEAASANADAAPAVASGGDAAMAVEPAPEAPSQPAAAPAAVAAVAAPVPDLGPQPYDFTDLAASAGGTDVEVYLPEAISFATRMVESLVTNGETSRAVVELGCVDLLLALHSLPRLPYTFGFSASSHALLAVFRQLAPTHYQVLSSKTADALSKSVDTALEVAASLPDQLCVPTLPPQQRAVWVKTVAVTAGLVAIASAVARNTTHMLSLLATGPKPLLPRLGQLERLLLSQAAVADAWAAAREHSERLATRILLAEEKDAARASPTTKVPTGSPSASSGAAAASGAVGGTVGAEPGVASVPTDMAVEAAYEAMQEEDVGAAGDVGEDLVMAEPPVARAVVGAGPSENGAARGAESDAAARAGRSGGGPGVARKKTVEELSVDILHHTTVMIRSFYVAVAKSIHTPARRSRDDVSNPSLGMRAAALGLASLLLGDLRHQLPEIAPVATLEAAAKAGVQSAVLARSSKPADVLSSPSYRDVNLLAMEHAAATAATVGTPRGATLLNAEAGATPSTPPPADGTPPIPPSLAGVVAQVTEARKARPLLFVSSHLARLSELTHMVLVDTRRRTCHVLILNFFVALGGLKALGARLGDAATALWALSPAGTPDVGLGSHEPPASTSAGDAVMGDAAAAGASAGAAGGTASAAVAAPLKRDPRQLTEKAIQGFLSVYELLASASIVLGSPQAGQLLVVPLPAGAGPAGGSQVRDPADLMRSIQAQAVEALLPLWSSPHFTHTPPAIMSQVVLVLNTCAEGVSAASSLLLRGRGGGALRLQGVWNPDPVVVQTLVDMGFTQPRAEHALRRIGMNSIEAATEWLLTHPDEPAPAAQATAAGGDAAPSTGTGSAATTTQPSAATHPDDEQLAAALASCLAALGLEPSMLEVPPPPAPPVQPSGAPEVAASPMDTSTPPQPQSADQGAATAVGAADTALAPKPSTATSLSKSLLGVDAMVAGAVTCMLQAPSDALAFSMGDLLCTLAAKEKDDGRPLGSVVGSLLALFRPEGLSPEQLLAQPEEVARLEAAARLLVVVLARDVPSREAVAKQGLVGTALGLLEAWLQRYLAAAANVPPDGAENRAVVRETLQVPVWVEACVLLLDAMAHTLPRKPKPGAASETGPAVDAGGEPAAGASEAATGEGASASATAQTAPAPKPSDPLALVMQDAHRTWRPCGVLEDAEQARCVTLCTSLLQALHTHGHRWAPSTAQLLDTTQAKLLPSPSSTTQALLLLLSTLTVKHSNAQAAMAAGVHRLVLSLPPACWQPAFVTVEAQVSGLLRHMMEDPVTLSGWMEAEVRAFFAKRARPRYMEAPGERPNAAANGTASLNIFLSSLQAVMGREPAVFLETVARLVTRETSASGDVMLRLKQGGEAGGDPGAVRAADESGAMPATAPTTAAATPAASTPSGSTATPRGAATAPEPAGAPAKPPAGSRAGSVPAKDPAAGVSGKAGGKKHVPGSLVEILDLLIDVIMQPDEPAAAPAAGRSMDIDAPTAAPAAAPGAEGAASENGVVDPPRAALQAALASPQAVLDHLSAYPARGAAQAVALHVLTDAVLLFSSSVGLLLKRDAELWAKAHPEPPPPLAPAPPPPTMEATPFKTPAAGVKTASGARTPTTTAPPAAKVGAEKEPGGGSPPVKPLPSHKGGAIIKRLIHGHLVAEDLPLVTQNRSERTVGLIQAICVRSVEGRKRITNEVVLTLLGADGGASAALGMDLGGFSPEELAVALAGVHGVSPRTGASFVRRPDRPAPAKVRALVNLVRWLLSSGVDAPPAVRGTDLRTNPAHLSAEMARTMREMGMVKALAAAMRQVATEHPRAARTLAVILHSLETLTRPVYVRNKQKPAQGGAVPAAQGEDGHMGSGGSTESGPGGEQAAPAERGEAGPSGSQPTVQEGAGLGAVTPAVTPGPSNTPAAPGTHVAATPGDAATGLRAPAGPDALHAVGRDQGSGGRRRGVARHAVAALLHDMGEADTLSSGSDEGEGDEDDEGHEGEEDEDEEEEDEEDEDMGGMDADMMGADDLLEPGMAIELPGGALLQVVEHDGPSDEGEEDEGLDTASDSGDGAMGEGEDSDEHPDARGDIGTDDDEVLETDEDEEGDLVDAGDGMMDDAHDPHGVMLDLEGGDGDDHGPLGGVVPLDHPGANPGMHSDDGEGDEEEEEEDEDEEEDEGQDDDEDGMHGGRHDEASVPGFDEEEFVNGGLDHGEDDEGATDEMDGEDVVNLGAPPMHVGRRAAVSGLLGRSRESLSADGADRNATDNDVGTGFGAAAEISPESLQGVLPTLVRLLGEGGIGGVVAAARRSGGGGSTRVMRVLTSDTPGGRSLMLDQRPIFPPTVPANYGDATVRGMGGLLANTAPQAVEHRLLARPLPTAPSQPALMSSTYTVPSMARRIAGLAGGAEDVGTVIPIDALLGAMGLPRLPNMEGAPRAPITADVLQALQATNNLVVNALRLNDGGAMDALDRMGALQGSGSLLAAVAGAAARNAREGAAAALAVAGPDDPGAQQFLSYQQMLRQLLRDPGSGPAAGPAGTGGPAAASPLGGYLLPPVALPQLAPIAGGAAAEPPSGGGRPASHPGGPPALAVESMGGRPAEGSTSAPHLSDDMVMQLLDGVRVGGPAPMDMTALDGAPDAPPMGDVRCSAGPTGATPTAAGQGAGPAAGASPVPGPAVADAGARPLSPAVPPATRTAGSILQEALAQALEAGPPLSAATAPDTARQAPATSAAPAADDMAAALQAAIAAAMGPSAAAAGQPEQGPATQPTVGPTSEAAGAPNEPQVTPMETDEPSGQAAAAPDQAMSEPMSTDASLTPSQPDGGTAAAAGSGGDAPAPDPAAPGSSLNAALRRAAASAGIDLAFLEALPEELRAEVLGMHGAQVVEDDVQPPAPGGGPAGLAVPPSGGPVAAGAGSGDAATAAETQLGLDPEFLAALPPDIRAELIAQQRMEQRRQAARARDAQAAARAAAAASAAAAQAATAAPATAAAASADAGTASTQTPSAAAPSDTAVPAATGRDVGGPSSGAAGREGSAGAAAPPGGDDDMDLAALLATFPPDVREDVLLSADEATLATLPPNVREEARVLRARFRANTFQQDDILPPPALGGLAAMLGGPGAGADGGGPAPRGAAQPSAGTAARMWAYARRGGGRAGADDPVDGRSVAITPALAQRRLRQEDEDLAMAALPQLVDQPDLAVMAGLLHMAPLPRSSLQRTLLHLTSHVRTRKALLRVLLGVVRALQDAADDAAAGAMDTEATLEQPETGTVVDAPALMPTTPLSIPGLGITVDATSCSALLRRVLETVAYLVRHSTNVARMLLLLTVPDLPTTLARQQSLPALWGGAAPPSGPLAVAATPSATAPTGQRQAADSAAVAAAPTALVVLLRTLSHPVCQRSAATLEGALHLMDYQLRATLGFITELQGRLQVEQQRREQEDAKVKAPPSQLAVSPMATDTPPAPTASVDAAVASPPRLPSAVPAHVGPSPEAPATAGGFGSPFSLGAASTGPGPSATTPTLTPSSGQPGAQPRQGPDPAPVQREPVGSLLEQRLAASLSAARAVLQDLPPELLHYPLELLAAPGMSNVTYSRTSALLRSLVEAAPSHLPSLLAELQAAVSRLSRSLEGVLASLEAESEGAAGSAGSSGGAGPGVWLQSEASSQQFAAIALQGACVLRLLHLLQAYRKQALKASGAESDQPPAPTATTPGADRTASFAGTSATSGGQASTTPAPAAAAGSSAVACGESTLAGPAYAAALDAAVNGVATSLEPLWQALSGVISHIEAVLGRGQQQPQQPQQGGAAAPAAGPAAASRLLPAGGQQVMPLVEAFFVVCGLQGAVPSGEPGGPQPATSVRSMDLGHALSLGGGEPSMGGAGGPSRAQSIRPSSSGLPSQSAGGAGASGRHQDVAFTRFAEKHRGLLNAYLRRSPTLLENSLAPLLHVPKLIDFDNKRAFFRAKVRQHDEQLAGGRPYGSLRLTVRREHVFEDSFHQLRNRLPEEMRLKLSVTFQGEEGIDAGGVTREWYTVMAREVFNLNLALFVQVPEGGSTFQPNPNSIVQSDRGVNHLDYFKFVGRVVGKALHDGQLIDAYFTRSFYKHLLGQALTYEDIEAVDPEYYKNLLWMLQNDITDVLDLTFTAETDFFGRKEVVDLVPGGKDIRVTEANKRQYVDLIARHRMTTSIKNQTAAFTQGFWELVPRHLIQMFNDHELELLISGLPDIDVDDLRANTEYVGYAPNAHCIRWFWEVVGGLGKEDRAQLIQFVTGTSKVPLEGFKALQGIGGPQKFQIHKAYGASDNRLPSAHTCFNQLDLPEYESKEVLLERLLMAIHEGATGFGFG